MSGALTGITRRVNIGRVIRSFADKRTRAVFEGQRVKRLPGDLLKRAQMQLYRVHLAAALADLKVPPGNRLEALAGDRAGQHSIRINGQWRVCFRWEQGHAHSVEIVDYH